jgi:hypothetical protein
LPKSFPPEIGPLSPQEIEIIDAALPSVAMENDAPLVTALEAILLNRCTEPQREHFRSLDPAEQMKVLDEVRAQIPMLPS